MSLYEAPPPLASLKAGQMPSKLGWQILPDESSSPNIIPIENWDSSFYPDIVREGDQLKQGQ